MEENKISNFDKKDKLIDAALNEFGERGYKNASLNNILKETGISKGTFYYYFKNKEQLYRFLILLLLEEKMKFFNENLNPEDLNNDIFTVLKIFTELGLKFGKTNPKINKFSLHTLKERENEVFKKIVKELNLQANNFLDSFIEKAYIRGDFRDDIPIEFTKRMISFLFINIQEVNNIIKVEDYEIAVGYLIEFMKNGLSKK